MLSKIFILRFQFILNWGCWDIFFYFSFIVGFLEEIKEELIFCVIHFIRMLSRYTDWESVSLSSTLMLLTNHSTNNEIINHFDRISVTYSSLQTSILKHIIYAYAPSSLIALFAKPCGQWTSWQRAAIYCVELWIRKNIFTLSVQ